ncbi:MAG TPA: hypothetical protein VKR99_04610 [Candidatus Eremiobacteraceae bacterium]|nr:hypothetical protein [Candidatus Eremiobacteraceae bacterium]
MRRLVTIGAIVFALSGTGISSASQPTPVPNMAPDFSSLNFLIGTWHCAQSIVGRPGIRTETDTYTMAYNGWQMQDHTVSPPFDKARTRNVVGDNWTTWDPTIKLWINQTVDNFGAYGLATSPGWVGKTMTWSGTNPDGTVGRSVNTKVSDTKIVYKNWGNTKKGQPQTLQSSGTCTKT